MREVGCLAVLQEIGLKFIANEVGVLGVVRLGEVGENLVPRRCGKPGVEIAIDDGPEFREEEVLSVEDLMADDAGPSVARAENDVVAALLSQRNEQALEHRL